MSGLPASRCLSLLGGLVFASFAVVHCQSQSERQFPDDHLLSSLSSADSNLWKSFQQEMKTLEEAAHRVNNLLTQARPEDGDTKAEAATPDEATVLATTTTKAGEQLTEPEPQPTQNGVTESSPNPHLSLGSLFNSFGLFRNFPEPWWKGKNVCVQKNEKTEDKNEGKKDESDKHVFIIGTGTFEHCKQTAGKYICTTTTSTSESTRTVSVTYQCCEGFQRKASGCEPGEATPRPTPTNPPTTPPTPANDARPYDHYDTVDVGKSAEESFSSQFDEGIGIVVLKEAVEVLEEVGSKDFAELIKSENLMHSLSDQNLTIFAPTDEAMRSYHVDFQESNHVGATTATTTPAGDVARAHIVASQLLDVDDFTNEMVLNSLNGGSSLRVNIYPGRQQAVMTVNCARVKSWAHLARRARVHTIQRVLEPVTRSVLDILDRPDLSQFRQYVEGQEGLVEMLSNLSGVTVFAPTNSAWDKLGAGLREKFSRGEACIGRVVRHHILPLTLCAAPASEGRLTTDDVDGETVTLDRDADDQLMVDDRGRVVQEDVMATNGVVHVLDKVITPKSAKPLSELLSSSNHTTWLDLLVRAGLADELDRAENVTLLVPTEAALADPDTRVTLDRLDGEGLRHLLLYHVTERAAACDLRDGASLRTRTGHTLRVSTVNPFGGLFSGALGGRAAVQCAPLALTDGRACGATAHEVTRLLSPPNGTALQMVATHPRLTLLKQIIQGTEIEKELQEVKPDSELADGFTMLAPSDDAFNKMDDEALAKLLTDKEAADMFVRAHIIKEAVCCASIASVPWPFTNTAQTLGSSRIKLYRDGEDRVVFGGGDSRAERCDLIATDSVVHVIDKVLLTEDNKVKLGSFAFGTPDKKIMLFGI